jgi:predicted metal-dependent phosphoesterase TrpH
MLFDIHVHSALSPCSRMDIGDILTRSRACGLDGVCITDHQSMAVRHVLKEGVQANGLCVIFGMEYSTAQGDFLLFGPFESLPCYLEASELLQSVQRCGGVAIAAHPFRANRPADEELIRHGLCQVIESVNGRNSPQENLAVDCWRQRYGLTECGGSDAHTTEELGTMSTRFFVPIRSRGELIHALQHRLCQPVINTPSAKMMPSTDIIHVRI